MTRSPRRPVHDDPRRADLHEPARLSIDDKLPRHETHAVVISVVSRVGLVEVVFGDLQRLPEGHDQPLTLRPAWFFDGLPVLVRQTRPELAPHRGQGPVRSCVSRNCISSSR